MKNRVRIQPEGNVNDVNPPNLAKFPKAETLDNQFPLIQTLIARGRQAGAEVLYEMVLLLRYPRKWG
jgi:hypothetical protein